MQKENMRIHGDNILECERTLHLIAESLKSKAIYQDSLLHNPLYTIEDVQQKKLLTIKLFPGYNRGGVNIYRELQKLGAPLREATDSIVTIISNNIEEVVFSIEFCNALPAGNNAWQRTGRALNCASVNIPYIYVSEIGGIELDSNRNQKAARFPNPIIPFSYITLGKNYNSLTLPIYLPSHSISIETKSKFLSTFGSNEINGLISSLIRGSNSQEIIESITKKNLQIVKVLANNRKRKDTLRNEEWNSFLNFESPAARLSWLEEKNIKWKKKSASKVATTTTFLKLLEISDKVELLSVGAGNIPICLLASKFRKKFAQELMTIYNNKLDKKFLEWMADNKSPLIIVWVNGFKPRGDDSRPDRGLVPLARMLLGDEANLVTIVYGPANKQTWKQLKVGYEKLAIQNGLWEAIFGLSDAVLIDSLTCDYSPFVKLLKRNKKIFNGKVKLPLSKDFEKISEQDVDSVIHFLFTKHALNDIFESMCNPPGGDWSGLSVKDFKKDVEYMWTSLPRVSKTEGKRPDHVIQYSKDENTNVFFSIESKDNYNSFSNNLGPRLNRYTNDLLSSFPTAIKTKGKEWGLAINDNKLDQKMAFISIGAFVYKNQKELESVLTRGKFDLVLGLEFRKEQRKTVIHLKAIEHANPFIEIIRKLAEPFKTRLEIEIH